MSDFATPWGMVDHLATYFADPNFQRRWREFLRECAILLLPGLPPEARHWMEAADELEAGRLCVESVTAARVAAWHFHNARFEISPTSELSGLRAVMWRLDERIPDTEVEWVYNNGEAMGILEEAGLSGSHLKQLLWKHFDELLSRA